MLIICMSLFCTLYIIVQAMKRKFITLLIVDYYVTISVIIRIISSFAPSTNMIKKGNNVFFYWHEARAKKVTSKISYLFSFKAFINNEGKTRETMPLLRSSL